MELFALFNTMLLLAKLNWQGMLDTLPLMAKGMAGIFIVILVIYIITRVLTIIFPNEKDKKKKEK